MSNCPLCRAPMREPEKESSRTRTCFSGHEVSAKSVLSGVLPIIPGWVCWQTISNSGVSDMRYAYWGPDTTANYKSDGAGLAQELIDRYEDWMNHAYHSCRIEWELDCAVPPEVIQSKIKSRQADIESMQKAQQTLAAQLEKHYPAYVKGRVSMVET